MMEVLATEKENRTMEILITSTSPSRMMFGKILGAIAIATLQLSVWIVFFLGATWIGGSLLEISWLQEITPNWGDLLQMIVVAVPVYLCITALFTTIGATLTEVHEAQQVGPLFLVLLYIPIWVLIPLADNLNGAVPLALSFFPPTALTAFGLRMVFIAVPWWQVAVAATIALLGAAVLAWLGGKTLRLNLLRYGQRFRWRDLLRLRKPPAPVSPRSLS
jgi:ABC-2 type transport system permease protein